MPHYQYVALDTKKKKKKGVIESISIQEAKIKLREQGWILLTLKEKKTFFKPAIKEESLLNFTLQLSELLDASVPVYESLLAIEEYTRGEPFHHIVLGISEKVKNGSSLSIALRNYPEAFPSLYIFMVQAGEASGSLSQIFHRLKELLKKQARLKAQLKTALIYPALLTLFALVVISLLLGFVIPSLEGIFEGRSLNGFTGCVLKISYLFRHFYGIYLPLIAMGIAFIVFQWHSPKGRVHIHNWLLRLPLVKNLLIESFIIRFCRTLGSLLQGGVSLIDALNISQGVIYYKAIETSIEKAKQKIIEGSLLSHEYSKIPYFPKLISTMLAIGEDAGTLPQMLQKIADIYEEHLDKILERLLALTQPIILIIMGGVIALIMLAILLPLTDLSNFNF